jgi:hypothetical protein
MPHAFWDFVFDHWSVTLLLPAVLLLMAALAFPTRVMDEREEPNRRCRRSPG